MKPSELIATPDKWTKGEMAKDADGFPVFSTQDSAVCWCLLGAINRACGIDANRVVIFNKLGFKKINELTDWNDAPERTHSDVLARLKGAGL